LSRGGRGFLAGPDGTVQCELEPLGIADGSVRYQLRVTNGTSRVLAATATAIRADDRSSPVAAIALEVGPRSALRTGFALDATLAYERIYAEVFGEGVRLLVEAPPLPGGFARRPWAIPAAIAGGAAIVAALMLFIIGAGRPHIVAAALSNGPGDAVTASWNIGGDGARSYEARNASGTVIAAGSLDAANGTLPLPPDTATLHIQAHNALGSDARDAVFARATPPPAQRVIVPAAAHIASLAVDPPQPGAPLTVRYDVRDARAMRLAMIDGAGAVWFSTTTGSGRGTVRIPPPPADRAPYRLVASANGDGGETTTSVPLQTAFASVPTVAPSPHITSAPETAEPAATAVPDAPTFSNADVLNVTPTHPHPGETIAVVVPSGDGARVALVRDRDSAEVAVAQLGRGHRTAELRAPAVGSYTMRATLQRGDGTETLLQAVRVVR
jgi:hypothetical protein